MTDIVDDPTFVRDLMDFASGGGDVYASAQIALRDTIGMSDAAATWWAKHYADLVCRGNDASCIDPLGSPASPSSPAHVRKRCRLIPQMATLPVDITN